MHIKGTWVAQSTEHLTHDLRVVSEFKSHVECETYLNKSMYLYCTVFWDPLKFCTLVRCITPVPALYSPTNQVL